MRLIDADALEDLFGVEDKDIIFKEILRDAPTVDAIPVVCCKNCIDYDPELGCMNYEHPMYSDDFYNHMNADDFCSYGERKD